MKIIELKAENVKRLKAVRIKPDGSVVQITGRNGAGKSSVLDAIAMALGGGREIPPRPIRDGAERAEVEIDLGDLLVRRVWTSDDKTYLAVETKEGAVLKSPQQVLDRLVGELSFDPLGFSRMTPKEQAQVLARLAGVDLDKHAEDRQKIYDDRTVENRAVSGLKAMLDGIPNVDGVPTEKVSVVELLAKRGELDRQRREDLAKRSAVALEEREVEAHARDVATLQEEIEALTKQLAEMHAEHSRMRVALDESRSTIADLPDVDEDISSVERLIESAESVNARFAEAERRAGVEAKLEEATGRSKTLGKQIAQLDSVLAGRIANAELPIDDLSIEEDRVLMAGVPFEQASSAEQLEVSVAMGLAMNPKLRVMLVRDGSLLDSEHLELMSKLAEDNDAQIWIERVASGDPVGVVIEDGEVVGAAEPVGTVVGEIEPAAQTQELDL